MTDAEPTPIERLQEAVQEFVNATTDEAVIVTAGFLTFEQMRFTTEGEQAHRIRYASLFNSQLATSVGLAEAGATMMRNTVELATDHDEEDE